METKLTPAPAPRKPPFFRRHDELVVYLAKCIAGALLVHGLSLAFGYTGGFWCLISLILVLTPDSKEALPLAVTRMKANLCGAAAALLALTFGPPGLVALALAIIVTGLLCALWNAMPGSRAAMAATIIVMQHDPGRHIWDTALERILAVILGCALGLLITLLFHRKLPGAPIVGE